MNEEEKPSPPPEVQFAAHVRGGIGHMTFGVSDLLAATAFYDAVLPCVGENPSRPLPAHSKDRCRMDKGIHTAPDTVNPERARPLRCVQTVATLSLLSQEGGCIWPEVLSWLNRDRFVEPVGFHFAFNASSPAAALKAGARDEGAAGPRPDCGKNYYAWYVRDLDGIKLECVYQE